jgi:ABC-type multidrug transport system ATPase subunit
MGEGYSEMSEFALQVENLVKVYQPRGLRMRRSKRVAVRAVDGLSFEVKRGQIFGLLGPNGAGKTTTLKVLNTLIRPTSGRASVLGYNVVAQPLEVRRRISVVIQESAVDLFLSTLDNLLTFARFHSVPAADAQRRAEKVMDLFHLREEAARKVQDLSGGFRRRVQVAKVFMVDTPVVFMDEFSAGMDPILKRAVMSLLREEAARGRTIVLTTQILSEAEELCDDILIMNKGKQVARGDMHALKLLSENVYDVSLTFEKLPAAIEQHLAPLAPRRMSVTGNTVEFSVKADEARMLALVAELAKKERVLRVEVSGANLEDIFVELMK